MDIAPNIAPLPAARPAEQAALPDSANAAALTAANSDFDSFLRLLTAQLRNQDPLQPLDSTEFVAQLASFSTVEQLISANEKLDALAAGPDLAEFAGWIGLDAGTAGGPFAATGAEMSFTVQPRTDADEMVLAIRAADGTVLRELPVDPAAGGRIVWDGADAAGNPVTAAGLTAETIALKGGELLDQQPAQIERRVTGLRVEGGVTRLVFADGSSDLPARVFSLTAPSAPADG